MWRRGPFQQDDELTACILTDTVVTASELSGRVSRDTLYEWLKDPAFKVELDRRRAELADQGLALLSQSVVKAVETLAGLLDAGDGRLRRLSARDILDQHGKFRKLDELTRRIEAIEERLAHK